MTDDLPHVELSVKIDKWKNPESGLVIYLAHVESDDGPCGMGNTEDEALEHLAEQITKMLFKPADA